MPRNSRPYPGESHPSTQARRGAVSEVRKTGGSPGLSTTARSRQLGEEMKSGCGGGGGGRSGRLLNWKGGGGQIPSSSSVVRTGASRRSVRVPPPPPRATPTSQQQQQQHSVIPVHMSEFAVLGLSPLASRNDVKNAYKRLALKYHPDVAAYSTDAAAARAQDREKAFREIKSAYESLMRKFEQEMETATTAATGFGSYGDEWEEWDDWMGFEGGVPVVYDHHS